MELSRQHLRQSCPSDPKERCMPKVCNTEWATPTVNQELATLD
eukprot:CAMPEP_0183349940 /NCGR_PEP_ID=MMETSP0164_2-20130417/15156_1 /TAXON_ID=221442 /ORGANISM="Coccolithus pelagicus ssp braarudi, Strain PLY182g" /LENGTH=42 /DNA_ID= /DNA_START= /DNA_END= /DNA_ORIENTATION=